MKLIAQVRLIVTSEQESSLKRTIQTANTACNFISEYAWQNKSFKQFDLHKTTYHTVRKQFPLSAQVVVRCTSKVADAYKQDKATQRTFRPFGAIAYDDRILSWKVAKSTVSIWTVDGRITLPFVCGDYQRQMLPTQQGQSDLVLINGRFYLLAVCDIDEPPLKETNGVLGIDLGISQIASDSEGRQYSGEPSKAYRRRLRALRKGLQKASTKSAKRHLKKAALRGSRFTKWLNHNISRQIVQNAVFSLKAIALETLSGIRERASGFNKEMRWQMGNWAFDQLKQFIAYKAKRAGIAVYFIDPRNTSRTCSKCGYCDKSNRKTQSCFLCLECGFQTNADLNASANIARKGLEARGIVTCPKVDTLTA